MGQEKKITEDGPCATTIFGNVMQFPSRFFRHFIMGKTNGALPPHQDPYFVPQNGDFMIARLVIIIALQRRLLGCIHLLNTCKYCDNTGKYCGNTHEY